MLLGMDWLLIHRFKVDFYEKAIECLDEAREKRVLYGRQKPRSVRRIIAMQAKCNRRKGCLLFVVHISNGKGLDGEVLGRYLIFL